MWFGTVLHNRSHLHEYSTSYYLWSVADLHLNTVRSFTGFPLAIGLGYMWLDTVLHNRSHLHEYGTSYYLWSVADLHSNFQFHKSNALLDDHSFVRRLDKYGTHFLQLSAKLLQLTILNVCWRSIILTFSNFKSVTNCFLLFFLPVILSHSIIVIIIKQRIHSTMIRYYKEKNFNLCGRTLANNRLAMSDLCEGRVENM